MRTLVKRVTEYLLCTPDTPQAAEYLTGIIRSFSDGELLCLTICSSRGKLYRQAARLAYERRVPVGILAAPRRFSRSRHIARQAYDLAGRYPGGKVVFFDEIAHTTEYQRKYADS